MSLVTVFLALLAIALFAGNALISLAAPKKQAKRFPTENNSFSYPSVQEPAALVGAMPENPSDKMLFLDARVNALSNKILMAHDRLQRIEEMLMQALSQQQNTALLESPGKSGDATVLGSRVDRLLDFKSNAEIEIAAIKDALREKGILPPTGKKKEQFSFETATVEKTHAWMSDDERKAHELVYHAAKK